MGFFPEVMFLIIKKTELGDSGAFRLGHFLPSAPLLCDFLSLTFQRIIESLALEGHLVQPPCNAQGYLQLASCSPDTAFSCPREHPITLPSSRTSLVQPSPELRARSGLLLPKGCSPTAGLKQRGVMLGVSSLPVSQGSAVL